MALHTSAAIVGLTCELDVDAVGLVNDVIVGDDVAARVDDEAGAKGLTLATAWPVVIFVAATTTTATGILAAEEAIEEVLHITLIGSALAVLAAVWVTRCLRLLRDLFGVDVYDRGTILLHDLGEAI